MNKLPQSTALREAGDGSESLSELMSRDPEGYQRADEDRIIAALRASAERWAALEASGQTKAPTKSKLATSSNLDLKDLL